MEYITHSPEETEALGAEYAKSLKAGDVVAFSGDLGAGKTAFTRGVLHGLGYEGRVTSPTFAIANEYETPTVKVAHFDLYRILDSEALFEIGFAEYLDGSRIVLIEWSENAADVLPEAYKAVMAAAAYDGPVYIRLGRSAVPTVTDPDADFVIGKGKLLREGTDVTLIACGMMVAVALDAAELLAAEGVNAAVIDMSTIKPIDRELVVKSALKTGKVVTVEEHSVIGGLGSAVCDVLAAQAPTKVLKIGINDTYGESGPAEHW